MGVSQALSDDDVRRYRRDGFLVPEYRLPDELLSRLVSATEQLITDRPDLIDQPIVGPHLPGGGKHGLHADRAFLDVATYPGLLDIVEQLTGPDLILMNALMFYKRAEQGPKVPWHRDGFALPIEPMGGTSLWIAVTESTIATGCLRFIPGSHLTTNPGTYDSTPRPDEMFSGSLDKSSFDESTAVDVPLMAGQLVIFDVCTIHGSQPNDGTNPRAGYACRYMPGTSVYEHDKAVVSKEPGYGHETRALMLARGTDRTGRNDFERGHARVGASS